MVMAAEQVTGLPMASQPSGSQAVNMSIPVQSSLLGLDAQLPAQVVNTQGEQDPMLHYSYNEQDIFIPDSIKNKIWNGEYVNLATLLKQNFTQSAYNDMSGTLAIINNQITIKQTPTKIRVPINSIQNWTDAFINYIIIYSLKHRDKTIDLLKYMAIVRGAAVNNPIHKWLEYDTQFRLRMSKEPTKNWATIDGHLWLSCGLAGDLTVVSQAAAPCYEYNFKGVCSRLNCSYAHTCIKCKVSHPASTCSLFQESKNANHSYRGFSNIRPYSVQPAEYSAPGPRPFTARAFSPAASFQHGYRPRMSKQPMPNYFRPNFRPQTRFMGPRANTY
ncbi:MAG: hypothetical protein JAY74_16150 [Candidatus Thiodiazotropha taylori]|nr:hypothetical protein [Candidatus Thiodiazotropha taylori]